MRKLTFLLSLACVLSVTSLWAETLVLSQRGQRVSSLTSGGYYVIAGYAQTGTTTNFLYDNGTRVQAMELTTGTTASNVFVWRLTGTAANGYVMQNLGTGNYVSLGTSNGSAVSMGATSQTLSVVFGSDNYAMIYNTTSGQAIDVGWAGTSPTTWASGGTTPTGSRRLFIYEADMEYVDVADWSVDLPSGYLSVGSQAATVSPATAGSDNDHWYLLTQVRGGESVMYDAGSGQKLKRADTSKTAASLSGSVGRLAEDYLVRFVPTSVAGVYNLQFANGRYITDNLTTGAVPGNYFFYNINGTDGHFAWNLTTDNATYGRIVDNNGAGYTLAFWESGQVTWTGSNNDWTVYPVTFFENGDYTWYTIQNKNAGYLSLNGDYMDGNNLLLTNTARPADRKALWRVERQSDGTYRFYNYTTGPTQVLGMSGSEASARAQMVDASLTSGDATYTTYFSFYDASKYPTGEATYIRKGSSGNNYWNKRGNYLALWNSSGAVGDNGSTFYFQEVDPEDYDDQSFSEFYTVNGVSSFTAPHPLTLWYNQPSTKTGVANEWMEYALPIGNGELGATEQGKVYTDEIQFNEKTLWSGQSTIGGNHGYYRNFGSVLVRDLSGTFSLEDNSAPVQDYVRWLDIEEAVAGVQFKSPDRSTTYRREYLSSHPDKVIAARYTAEGTDRLNLRFTYEPGSSINASALVYTDGTASFSGKLDVVSYHTMFKVVTDGIVTTTDTKIVVSDATEVLLLLTGGTDYDAASSTFVSGTSGLASTMASRLSAAEAKGWTALRADHVTDFQSYMGRVSLQLGTAAPNPSRTTQALVNYYSTQSATSQDAEALFLEQLYFQYGRYLEISSNRDVNVPNNLQGIWNNLATAPWHSDIHTNINIQMNYWPSEPTNLSELHLPFLNFIINMAARNTYRQAATQYGGVSNGWTVFTESNIFGGMSTWGSNYFVANAWYCSHLWQHYRYTLDQDFLARAFPALWSCAQFWMERMIEDRGYNSATQNSGYGGTAYSFTADGTYVAPNEYSPEQDAHNSEDGTAHAQQLIYAVLESVKEAHDILGASVTGLSAQDVAKLNLYLEKTDRGLHTETYTANSSLNGGWTNPRNGVAKGDVILREWKYSPYDVSTDPSHRHLSHLMCLYPLSQVSKFDEDPTLFQAAVNSLKLRGDDATGWSLGWKVNCWARAHDGDHAHTIIHNALRHSTAYTTNQYAGGVYYNLFDSHAPFQIDGNFGTCAGIAEMLMQSATGVIDILPALPSAWPSGSVSGLKAVGDNTVDIQWADGAPTRAAIHSNKGGDIRFCSDAFNATYSIVTVNGTRVAPVASNGAYTLTGIHAGDDVQIVFLDGPSTVYTVSGGNIEIKGTKYRDGDTFVYTGTPLTKADVVVEPVRGKYHAIVLSENSIQITYTDYEEAAMNQYTQAVVYPAQQTAVGAANLTVYGQEGAKTYVLGNNVLTAAFVQTGGRLLFGGSEAMNLLAGTEPFTVAFGTGTKVAASEMTLTGVSTEEYADNAAAVGGAEHFAGKALVATYTYDYEGATLQILWRAVLRDGSHYLRTEMELTGQGDVDMYNVVPLLYNVDTETAGSTPAVVGNTRGAVLVSNQIFAGLETPTAYNSVGDEASNEDNWTLTNTLTTSLTAASWTQVAAANVPARVTEATGYGYPNIYAYTYDNVTLTANQKVELTIKYTSGNHRLNFGGADLLDASGNVCASDYHSGYSGGNTSNNVFTFIAPYAGTFRIRALVENGTESIDASSTWTAKMYTPKEGVVLNTGVATMQGLWSRNTTLENGETWKVGSVVGLVAQDGQSDNPVLTKTQKRRSFLAYSERERAVPWRAFPAYISWYELNINRNNATDPTQNMNASQVVDVVSHWKTQFYDRYKQNINSFVIDDGWDNYGTWTFHSGFPNEMRDIAGVANEMGSGVGAWLGPVGGYGTSGTYRRNYWSSRGGMVLSNRAYYNVFLDAAQNLTANQGTDAQGNGLFRFFKFDGISAQFSATGPDSGDTGNENAEGILRLERYVRENLKRDIFFNTTVGTWASPFFYHFTDATWRQENDYGTIGDNTNNREKWITYRDRLVYQNYVQNSPLCPINTLMTHGFILTRFGSTNNVRDYASVKRELRAAFACGSGMVELYNDYLLTDSIRFGKLWHDIAECSNWQKFNADVLPDAHWVGGSPWDGSNENVYGWASWNGTKCTLALRNGDTSSKSYTFTLREALNIPANWSGSIKLHRAFSDQAALTGLTEGGTYDIDQSITVTLPASTIYVFGGIEAGSEVPVSTIAFDQPYYAISKTAAEAKAAVSGSDYTTLAEATASINYTVNADATCPVLTWTSSDPTIAEVNGGWVLGKKAGVVTITATTADGSVARSVRVFVATPAYMPGDVNRDGSVTIADVTALVNVILGKDNGATPLYDHAAADVNADGSVTIADVTALVNLLLGK